jgi:hypothetical protein
MLQCLVRGQGLALKLLHAFGPRGLGPRVQDVGCRAMVLRKRTVLSDITTGCTSMRIGSSLSARCSTPDLTFIRIREIRSYFCLLRSHLLLRVGVRVRGSSSGFRVLNGPQYTNSFGSGFGVRVIRGFGYPKHRAEHIRVSDTQNREQSTLSDGTPGSICEIALRSRAQGLGCSE